MDELDNKIMKDRIKKLLSSDISVTPEFEQIFRTTLLDLNQFILDTEAHQNELKYAYHCIEEQSRENFALFEHAPVAYCVLSEDLKIVKLNRRCRDLLSEKGFSRDKPLPELYYSSDQPLDLHEWLADDFSDPITINFSTEPEIWHLMDKKPYHHHKKLISITDVTTQINATSMIDGVKEHLVTINSRMSPLHILLAEDDPSNQVIMKSLLEKMGHQVDVVENGQAAVDAFHYNDFDLIIMDSHMPVMTGYQATQIIRSSIKDQPKHIPILSWTIDARREHVNHLLKIGMNGILSKPINQAELQRTLHKFCH